VNFPFYLTHACIADSEAQDKPLDIDPNFDKIECFKQTRFGTNASLGGKIEQKKVMDDEAELNIGTQDDNKNLKVMFKIDQHFDDSSAKFRNNSQNLNGSLNKVFNDDSKDQTVEHLNVIMNPEEDITDKSERYSDIKENVQFDQSDIGSESGASSLIQRRDQYSPPKPVIDNGVMPNFNENNISPRIEDNDQEMALPHSVQTERNVFNHFKEPKKSSKYFMEGNVRSTPTHQYSDSIEGSKQFTAIQIDNMHREESKDTKAKVNLSISNTKIGNKLDAMIKSKLTSRRVSPNKKKMKVYGQSSFKRSDRTSKDRKVLKKQFELWRRSKNASCLFPFDNNNEFYNEHTKGNMVHFIV